MSAGGARTVPPCSRTTVADSSALVTQTHILQPEVVAAPSDGDPMAATSRSRICPTRYLNGADSGARLWKVHPKSPP